MKKAIGKYVLITGGPVDGFSYYGPFEYPSSAKEFAEDYLTEEQPIWIVPLISPLEFLDENDPARE